MPFCHLPLLHLACRRCTVRQIQAPDVPPTPPWRRQRGTHEPMVLTGRRPARGNRQSGGRPRSLLSCKSGMPPAPSSRPADQWVSLRLRLASTWMPLRTKVRRVPTCGRAAVTGGACRWPVCGARHRLPVCARKSRRSCSDPSSQPLRHRCRIELPQPQLSATVVLSVCLRAPGLVDIVRQHGVVDADDVEHILDAPAVV